MSQCRNIQWFCRNDSKLLRGRSLHRVHDHLELPLKFYVRTWSGEHRLFGYMCTCALFPAEVFGIVWVSEVTRVQDINISLLDDLHAWSITLLWGWVKKLSQLSTWSNTSGKNMRLGLSLAVDWMCTPRRRTWFDSTRSDSEWKRRYFHGYEWWLRSCCEVRREFALIWRILNKIQQYIDS